MPSADDGKWPWQLHINRPPSSHATGDAVRAALASLQPIRRPASSGGALWREFTWRAVARHLTRHEIDWYVVAFRSVRKPDADTDLLHVADAFAHLEARRGGGLLAYTYGDIAGDRCGLAMCIWESAAHARAASQKPLHRRAAALAEAMYETFALECYTAKKPRFSEALVLQAVASPCPHARS